MFCRVTHVISIFNIEEGFQALCKEACNLPHSPYMGKIYISFTKLKIQGKAHNESLLVS